LIGGIVPARVFRERPGNRTLKALPDSAPLPRHPDAVALYNSEPDRYLHLEISLNDFGLESLYGRFLREKIYSLHSPALCGVLVDLYV